MRGSLLLLLSAALVIAACEQPIIGRLGSQFQVDAGQSARIVGTDLQLMFVRVDSDSRCPVGVQCITAGEAVIALRAQTQKAGTHWLRLRLPGGAQPDSTSTRDVGGYHVSVMGLDPPPAAGIRTDSTAYVATLVVTR